MESMSFKSQSAPITPEKLSGLEAKALFDRFDRHVDARVRAAMAPLSAKARADKRTKAALRKLVIAAARNRVAISAPELKALATRGSWKANSHAEEIGKSRLDLPAQMIVKRYRAKKRFVFFDNKKHYSNTMRDELFGKADHVFLRAPGTGPNGKKLLIRISREPGAIQAQTPRRLVGAMNLIGRGALACSLVEETDPHAFRPLKSMLIRPLANKDGAIYYGPNGRQRDSQLGKQIAAFFDATLNTESFGAFRLHNPGVDDYTPNRILLRRMPADSRPLSAAKFLSMMEIETRTVNGKLVVPSALDLSNLNLTHLPDLTDVEVQGDFKVSGNQLTDLTGAPAVVHGEYWADDAGLHSLKGAPKSTPRGFYASGNNLTDLAHAPVTVGGSFSAHNNQLTSLQGAPRKVRLNFGVAGNKLTSLIGGPDAVGYDYICRDNRLTSLEGIASTIGKDINCDTNCLETLHGIPDSFDGDITCGGNPLSGLTGIPATMKNLKGLGQRSKPKAEIGPDTKIDSATKPGL
ncbi:MAG: hypothetical protein Alpg2KO_15110 [Alphaproteobacteria bacterium]